MSRRKRSGRGSEGGEGERAGESRSGPAGGVGGRARGSWSGQAGASRSGRPNGLGFLPQLVVLAAAFGLGVGVAEVAGAANLGTAFGIGQIVFAITLLFLLVRA